MARIIANRAHASAVIHSVVSNTVVIAGNNSVSGIATGSEVLTGATIKQIFWGVSQNHTWTVARGSNTVAVLTGTDHLNYAGMGAPINLDPGATLVLTLSGGDGYIMVDLQKIGNTTPQAY